MARFDGNVTSKTKACIVCGQVLPVYVRICDRCGSIQRLVTGDGVPIPPDQMEICELCGREMLKPDTPRPPKARVLCHECEELVEGGKAPHKKHRRSTAKRSAIAFGSFGVATAAGGAIAAAVGGATPAAITLFSLAGVFALLAAGAYFLLRRRTRKKQQWTVLPKPAEYAREGEPRSLLIKESEDWPDIRL